MLGDKVVLEGYAAIRTSRDGDGRLWIDSSTIELLREMTEDRVTEFKKKCAILDKANPVVRIVKVEIREVDEGR